MRTRTSIRIATVVAALTAGVLVLGAAPAGAAPRERTITVVGTGQVKGTPDVAEGDEAKATKQIINTQRIYPPLTGDGPRKIAREPVPPAGRAGLVLVTETEIFGRQRQRLRELPRLQFDVGAQCGEPFSGQNSLREILIDLTRFGQVL